MMYDVIIVGAGFAGLSAAVDLAGRGVRVLVLESRPRLGGRATSYPDARTGELVDNGQHVLFGCYRETFRFLRRVGAAGDVRLQTTLAVDSIDVDGTPTRLECPLLPPPLHLLAGVLEWERIPFGERLAALRMLGPLYRARRDASGTGRSADGATETVRDWLVRHGQGPRLRELLWEPLALAALNQQPQVAAARPFARVLAELSGSETTDAAIGVPLRPLELLYAEPARRFLEGHGATVRTRARARVHVGDRRLTGVDAGGDRLTSPAVIAAVPWHAVGPLLPGRPEALATVMANAAATTGSPIVTVNLWLDRVVLPAPFVGLPGRTMQWAFDKRAVFGGGATHVSMVSSGADDVARRPGRQVIDQAVAELRRAVPGHGWRVEHASVIREPAATFSLAPGAPPRPDTTTPVGGLFLAGDWIETGLPGTIESAVLSGHRAAAAAYAWLSRAS